MSENKTHAFRIMVIDIAEDKLVLDEFCDAIIVGISRSDGDPKINEAKEFMAAKCHILTQSCSVKAAEKAIATAKKEVVESFMRDATPEILKELFSDSEVED